MKKIIQLIFISCFLLLSCEVEKIENSENIESVSATFDVEGHNENHFIEIAASELGVKSHKVNIKFEGIINELDKVIWHMDEPFHSMSVVAAFKVFKEARKQNISVMINGQGADEILGGYDIFYKPYFLQKLRNAALFSFLSSIIGFFKNHKIGLSFILKTLIRPLIGFFSTKKESWLNLKGAFSKKKQKTMEDCSIYMIKEVGLPMYLHYEDRASMAYSVEARVPFLDYQLVEFSLLLNDEMKIKKGIRKYILREAMKDILPKKIYTRYDKQGFILPDAVWMKEYESFFVAELKDAIINLDKVINDEIIQVYRDYLLGKTTDYSVIWRCIVFNRWVKLFGISNTK